MKKGISLLSWRSRASGANMLTKPVEAEALACERAPGEGRKRIVTFLALTVALSAVWEALIIRAGTLHAGGGLFVFGLMWSPGIAALITTYALQRNSAGMGWRLSKTRYLLVGYGLPLAEAVLVYGVV